ncbi:hypothetical protein [Aureimonas sp. SA4125]|nr:hypothetical protein [Aureimonas sp. SA4125]
MKTVLRVASPARAGNRLWIAPQILEIDLFIRVARLDRKEIAAFA